MYVCLCRMLLHSPIIVRSVRPHHRKRQTKRQATLPLPDMPLLPAAAPALPLDQTRIFWTTRHNTTRNHTTTPLPQPTNQRSSPVAARGRGWGGVFSCIHGAAGGADAGPGHRAEAGAADRACRRAGRAVADALVGGQPQGCLGGGDPGGGCFWKCVGERGAVVNCWRKFSVSSWVVLVLGRKGVLISEVARGGVPVFL